jgi:hypothetical protein
MTGACKKVKTSFFLGCFMVALAIWFSVQETGAQELQKKPIAVITRGGVSLGSYQGGYHYYCVEWLKKQRDSGKIDVKVVTGASAGAINALLTVFSLSTNIENDPTNSVFYKAWIPVNLNILKGSKSPLSLFQRDSLSALTDQVLAPELDKNSKQSLDIALGITATRVNPYYKNIGNINVPKVDDKFIIRVSKEPGKSLSFRNYLYNDLDWETPILPFGDSANIVLLKGLVFASSTFPLAFSPQELTLRMINTQSLCESYPDLSGHLADRMLWGFLNSLEAKEKAKSRTDKRLIASQALFLDGGIIDNQPIGLAHTIGIHGIMKQGNQWVLRDNLSKEENADARDSIRIFYIDPGNAMYPKFQKASNTSKNSIITYAWQTLGTFADASMNKELYDYMKNCKERNERFPLQSENYAPIASGYLSNFFGFFDENIRRFDFMLGIYEAERNIRQFLADSLLQNGEGKKSESATIHRSSKVLIDTFANEYKCMQRVFDDFYKRIEEFSPSASRSLDLKDIGGKNAEKCIDRQFTKLLQVTIDILWLRWKLACDDKFENVSNKEALTLRKDAWNNAIKYAATWPTISDLPRTDREKIFPPNEREIRKYKEFLLDQSDLDVMLCLLSKYQYTFSQFGKERSPDVIKMRLTKALQGIIDGLAKKQKKEFRVLPLQRILISSTSKKMLNFYSYYPTKLNLKGSATISWNFLNISWKLPFYDALRLDLGGMFHKLDIAYEYFASAGLEFELFGPFHGSFIQKIYPVIQPRICLDAFAGRNHDRGHYLRDGILFGWYPKLSTTILESIYLSCGSRIYTNKKSKLDDNPYVWKNKLMWEIGAQISLH